MTLQASRITHHAPPAGGRSSFVVGRSTSSDLLPISVVVPARDEGTTVEVLLASLVAQERGPAEILVVDAGSRDDTAARVERWSARDVRVRLVRIGPAYPGVARNAGIAAATQEWIALTDAGIRVAPDWLAQLWVTRVREPEAELVFGHFEPAQRGWFDACATLAYVTPCVETDGRWWRGGSVASMLLRRDLWQRCGGFPPFRAGEDLIFLEAVARNGCRTAVAPAARVTWDLSDGPAATFRRFALYSRHNLIAGRGRHWHGGTVRLYAAAALIAFGGWLWSPVLWGLLPLGVVARAARAVRVRRRGCGVTRPWRPDRLAGVAFIQLLLDAATLWGALVWALEDVLRPRMRGVVLGIRRGGTGAGGACELDPAGAQQRRPGREAA